MRYVGLSVIRSSKTAHKTLKSDIIWYSEEENPTLGSLHWHFQGLMLKILSLIFTDILLLLFKVKNQNVINVRLFQLVLSSCNPAFALPTWESWEILDESLELVLCPGCVHLVHHQHCWLVNEVPFVEFQLLSMQNMYKVQCLTFFKTYIRALLMENGRPLSIFPMWAKKHAASVYGTAYVFHHSTVLRNQSAITLLTSCLPYHMKESNIHPTHEKNTAWIITINSLVCTVLVAHPCHNKKILVLSSHACFIKNLCANTSAWLY